MSYSEARFHEVNRLTSPLQAKTQLQFFERKLNGPSAGSSLCSDSHVVYIVKSKPDNSPPLKQLFAEDKLKRELAKKLAWQIRLAQRAEYERTELEERKRRAEQLVKENGEREEREKPKPIDIKAEIESLLGKYR